MDLTRTDSYYLLAAKKFKAVAWTMETKPAEFERLYAGFRVIRMTADPERALVVSIAVGQQRVVQLGEVMRVNQITGGVQIMTQEEFMITHGVAR
jgi:hypothetical protein